MIHNHVTCMILGDQQLLLISKSLICHKEVVGSEEQTLTSQAAYQEHRQIMHWALGDSSNGAFNLRLPGSQIT